MEYKKYFEKLETSNIINIINNNENNIDLRSKLLDFIFEDREEYLKSCPVCDLLKSKYLEKKRIK